MRVDPHLSDFRRLQSCIDTCGRFLSIRATMKLRDHPMMTCDGIANWPPVWTRTRKESVVTVTGEIGVLVYVHSNPLMSRKCFLVIDHGNETYVGTVIFETHALCKKVCELLSLQLKKSIQDIGDMEL